MTTSEFIDHCYTHGAKEFEETLEYFFVISPWDNGPIPIIKFAGDVPHSYVAEICRDLEIPQPSGYSYRAFLREAEESEARQ